MSFDPATVRYMDLVREWRQRAGGCLDEEERTIFLAIADGYEQLASLSKNPDTAGYFIAAAEKLEALRSEADANTRHRG